jgi:ATP-dependent DNA helicase RecG
MFSTQEIQEILAQGENSSVEFKSAQIRPDALAKEIAAFANTSGGVILLGVGDNDTIEGIGTEKNYEEWSMNIARTNVSPAVSIEYQSLEIDGKRIAILSVPKGQDKPYQVAEQYFVRVGSTNRRATQGELLRLFQAAGIFHYDSVAVAGTSIKDINLTKIDQYFQRYEIDFSSETEQERQSLLMNTDILTASGEATVAGLLIFGINPSRYLPQCGISFAHFAGNEIAGELLDKQNIDGTLDYQVDTGLAVLKNNRRIPSTIKGAKREESQEIIPDSVFRELLVNACVHRTYSITGSKIRVFQFDTRIEFLSPGRLPNTVTIEKLRAGVSYAVNPVIVKFMENLRYIDRLGRGLPMVCREIERIGGQVEFKELGEEFKVTILFP